MAKSRVKAVTKVVDKDRGYRRATQKIGKLTKGQARLEVGILSGASEEVLEKATYNEFGTEDIPARPFVRGYVDAKKAELVKARFALYQRVLAGQMTEEQALELLGVKVVGGIQARISGGIPPANAESTIKQKGSSTPLIDSGQLRSSISSRVIPRGGGQ